MKIWGMDEKKFRKITMVFAGVMVGGYLYRLILDTFFSSIYVKVFPLRSTWAVLILGGSLFIFASVYKDIRRLKKYKKYPYYPFGICWVSGLLDSWFDFIFLKWVIIFSGLLSLILFRMQSFENKKRITKSMLRGINEKHLLFRFLIIVPVISYIFFAGATETHIPFITYSLIFFTILGISGFVWGWRKLKIPMEILGFLLLYGVYLISGFILILCKQGIVIVISSCLLLVGVMHSLEVLSKVYNKLFKKKKIPVSQWQTIIGVIFIFLSICLFISTGGGILLPSINK